MANAERSYNKKECIYVRSTYLLRAQLVMPFRNAKFPRPRRFPTGYRRFARRDLVQERNSGTDVFNG